MAKAQSVLGYKGIYVIVVLFMLTFLFLYLHNSFASYQNEKIQCAGGAIQDIMIAKFFYSTCFAYVDPDIQQTLPGTVDLSKFTQENLETCFTYINEKVNISIEGKTIGKQIYKPQIINKTIWVYENGQQRSSTIQFTFEEPAC